MALFAFDELDSVGNSNVVRCGALLIKSLRQLRSFERMLAIDRESLRNIPISCDDFNPLDIETPEAALRLRVEQKQNLVDELKAKIGESLEWLVEKLPADMYRRFYVHYNFSSSNHWSDGCGPSRPELGDFARNISPPRTDFRDLSPLRTDYRDLPPVRDHSPPRLYSRDMGPCGQDFRDISPRRSNFRAISPQGRNFRDISPRRPDYHDFSPRRPDFHDFSPGRSDFRDVSPRRRYSREMSPPRPDCRDVSARRTDFRDISPRRAYSRDNSPRRLSPDFSDVSPQRTNFRDTSPRRTRQHDTGPQRMGFRNEADGRSHLPNKKRRQRSRNKASRKSGSTLKNADACDSASRKTDSVDKDYGKKEKTDKVSENVQGDSPNHGNDAEGRKESDCKPAKRNDGIAGSDSSVKQSVDAKNQKDDKSTNSKMQPTKETDVQLKQAVKPPILEELKMLKNPAVSKCVSSIVSLKHQLVSNQNLLRSTLHNVEFDSVAADANQAQREAYEASLRLRVQQKLKEVSGVKGQIRKCALELKRKLSPALFIKYCERYRITPEDYVAPAGKNKASQSKKNPAEEGSLILTDSERSTLQDPDIAQSIRSVITLKHQLGSADELLQSDLQGIEFGFIPPDLIPVRDRSQSASLLLRAQTRQTEVDVLKTKLNKYIRELEKKLPPPVFTRICERCQINAEECTNVVIETKAANSCNNASQTSAVAVVDTNVSALKPTNCSKKQTDSDSKQSMKSVPQPLQSPKSGPQASLVTTDPQPEPAALVSLRPQLKPAPKSLKSEPEPGLSSLTSEPQQSFTSRTPLASDPFILEHAKAIAAVKLQLCAAEQQLESDLECLDKGIIPGDLTRMDNMTIVASLQFRVQSAQTEIDYLKAKINNHHFVLRQKLPLELINKICEPLDTKCIVQVEKTQGIGEMEGQNSNLTFSIVKLPELGSSHPVAAQLEPDSTSEIKAARSILNDIEALGIPAVLRVAKSVEMLHQRLVLAKQQLCKDDGQSIPGHAATLKSIDELGAKITKGIGLLRQKLPPEMLDRFHKSYGLNMDSLDSSSGLHRHASESLPQPGSETGAAYSISSNLRAAIVHPTQLLKVGTGTSSDSAPSNPSLAPITTETRQKLEQELWALLSAVKVGQTLKTAGELSSNSGSPAVAVKGELTEERGKGQNVSTSDSALDNSKVKPQLHTAQKTTNSSLIEDAASDSKGKRSADFDSTSKNKRFKDGESDSQNKSSANADVSKRKLSTNVMHSGSKSKCSGNVDLVSRNRSSGDADTSSKRGHSSNILETKPDSIADKSNLRSKASTSDSKNKSSSKASTSDSKNKSSSKASTSDSKNKSSSKASTSDSKNKSSSKASASDSKNKSSSKASTSDSKNKSSGKASTSDSKNKSSSKASTSDSKNKSSSNGDSNSKRNCSSERNSDSRRERSGNANDDSKSRQSSDDMHSDSRIRRPGDVTSDSRSRRPGDVDSDLRTKRSRNFNPDSRSRRTGDVDSDSRSRRSGERERRIGGGASDLRTRWFGDANFDSRSTGDDILDSRKRRSGDVGIASKTGLFLNPYSDSKSTPSAAVHSNSQNAPYWRAYSGWENVSLLPGDGFSIDQPSVSVENKPTFEDLHPKPSPQPAPQSDVGKLDLNRVTSYGIDKEIVPSYLQRSGSGNNSFTSALPSSGTGNDVSNLSISTSGKDKIPSIFPSSGSGSNYPANREINTGSGSAFPAYHKTSSNSANNFGTNFLPNSNIEDGGFSNLRSSAGGKDKVPSNFPSSGSGSNFPANREISSGSGSIFPHYYKTSSSSANNFGTNFSPNTNIQDVGFSNSTSSAGGKDKVPSNLPSSRTGNEAGYYNPGSVSGYNFDSNFYQSAGSGYKFAPNFLPDSSSATDVNPNFRPSSGYGNNFPANYVTSSDSGSNYPPANHAASSGSGKNLVSKRPGGGRTESYSPSRPTGSPDRISNDPVDTSQLGYGGSMSSNFFGQNSSELQGQRNVQSQDHTFQQW